MKKEFAVAETFANPMQLHKKQQKSNETRCTES